MSIFWTFSTCIGDGSRQFHWTLTYQRHFLYVITKRVCFKKYHQSWCDPFTALYRSFLKRCFLTNKAVGTIWRALSKHPQRRQGPDPRPLWLLVGTPSALGHELVYRLRVAQPTLMDVPIFLIYFYITIYHMFVYHIFMTSPLWLAVGPQSL